MALPKNSDEQHALDKFQNLVEDLDLDKGTLMRFLRARNLDLTNAEKMIRAFAEWRVKNIYEPALIGWKPHPKFINQFEIFHCGPDSEERPVFYLHFGKWLPCRHVYEEFASFDVVLFAYKSFINLFEDIQRTQHQQVVAIIDFEGIGFSTMLHEIQYWTGVQTLIDIWSLYEANFPETLHKAFFVNTARAFMFGFNLVKPFVSKNTLSKISIFGTDECKWKSALHDFLPVESIPEHYGGRADMSLVYDIVYDGHEWQ